MRIARKILEASLALSILLAQAGTLYAENGIDKALDKVDRAEANIDQAQHDAALAEFNLAAATGRLIAPELKLPVKLYDMDRHYKAVKGKWFGFGGGLKQ